MSSEANSTQVAIRGKAAFCLHLFKALPSLPGELESKLGPVHTKIVDLSSSALESGLDHNDAYVEGLCSGLLPIIRVAEKRAEEIERSDYTPGNNYGFGGAAETESEIYRYMVAYLRTLIAGLALDTTGCSNAFRGALTLYAIHSCHGDPKGAVHYAISEAKDEAGKIIQQASAFLSLDSSTDQQDGQPDAAVDAPADVFISFKHLDGNGNETRDCELAKRVAALLRKKKFAVFFSLDSLERLGTSAYKEAIDETLDRAKVLIAVGTSREHMESRWVRYEWDSFLQDIISGLKPSAEIFTVIDGIPLQDLPRGLRHRQSFGSSDAELERLSKFLSRALP